jgi:2',3'-cyclic-nucleotide 2'-phosphodiesterase (5'-nucleotidase family)
MLLMLSGGLVPAPATARAGDITLVHTGDFHGHLIARPNVRSDGAGRLEGGLARIYTKIQEIRAREQHTLLLHTGDTIQGSAEVLYTRGQAIVDVVNLFKIDAFAPGNWEFVYGNARFLELFGGARPKAPWNALAANVYYSTLSEDPTTPYPDKAGLLPNTKPRQRVLRPYSVKRVGALKVGILGFTTDRGPQVVGKNVTKGFTFTKGDAELKELLPVLRDKEKVDLVVMISELGLANNIRLAEAHPGIDVILSSDMHEETHKPVVTKTGTIIIEEGQDGTMMGELKLRVEKRRVKDWKFTPYNITADIPEDKSIAEKIRQVRKTFVSGPGFVRHVNPFNGTLLQRPIDTVVGYTKKPLHRSNFTHEDMPGVIEGSSHDFLADAFRAVAGADIGAIRGFRYGTHVVPGPIKMEDLYHFIPIGPVIAKGTIKGQQLKNQIENSADGSLNPDVSKWTGGWLFNFSGVTLDFDAYQPKGQRAGNIRVNGKPLDLTAPYTYASYWYAGDPNLINVVPTTDVVLLKDKEGKPMDGTEVVVQYLESLPGRTADTQLNRIRLLAPLPAAKFGFPEVQPLRGAAK